VNFFRLKLSLVRRIFFIGMPGANKRESSSEIARHFHWEHVHVGDLLQKEVNKKTDRGKKIQAAMN
jgi:adenylate kinase family enzyme